MGNNYSTKIQGIKTLDLNRQVRFNDKTFKRILECLQLEAGQKLLDLGCGPGTFTRTLAQHVKGAHIVGLDFDDNFIDYCKAASQDMDLTYLQGDALKTPFEDGTFDVCSSHTVIEHLPTQAFIREQHRLLRTGGRLVIFNVRADRGIVNQEEVVVSDREKALMEPVSQVLDQLNKTHRVSAYQASPQEILRTMERVGFKDICVDVIPYVTCMDDSRLSQEDRLLIIESEQESLIEYIHMARSEKEDLLSSEEYEELIGLIKKRFDDRKEEMKAGKTLWNFNAAPNLAFTGIKA